MVKKTVLKVDISCQKCKKKLLKAISGLKGVDKIEADAGKGTITVTGDADPYDIIARTRKAGGHAKFAELLSVGPPQPPPNPNQKQDPQKKPTDEKKPEPKKDDKKPDPNPFQFHNPHTCPVCQHHQMCLLYMDPRYTEPNPSCSVM